jgi:hypothetical protein
VIRGIQLRIQSHHMVSTLDRERGFEENVDNEDQEAVIASASASGFWKVEQHVNEYSRLSASATRGR